MFNLRPLYYIFPFLLTTYLPPNISLGSPLDLDSTHMIFHYHGTDTSSEIGANLKALGDINSEGYDDISVSSNSPVGTYIFLGGSPPDSFLDFFLQGNRRVGDYIDYTGDSVPDIVTSYSHPTHATDGVIYLYQGYGDSLSSQPTDSITMPDSLNVFALRVGKDLGKDVGDDFLGIGDLLVAGNNPYEGNRILLYLNPFASDKIPDWTFSVDFYSHSLWCSGFIDFNGDHFLDIYIALSADLDTLSYIYIFLCPMFGSEPDVIIGHPVEIDSVDIERFAERVFEIGDINGDGREDLGVDYSIVSLIYLCGPDADTISDYVLQVSSKYMAGAGDVNGDGYDDIMFSCQNFAFGDPFDVFIFSGGDDITTDVGDIKIRSLPDQCMLKQNHPNPFNQSIVIEFELARRSVVTLEVYNCQGQRIATLIDGKAYSAALHRIIWDGQLSDGSPAPSGVYFCRLRADGIRDTRRMVLIR